MRISEYTSTRICIDFDYEEVEAMLAKDEYPLTQFANLLQKYHTWILDVKKIRTKELLHSAQ